jgi:hypothetical protein
LACEGRLIHHCCAPSIILVNKSVLRFVWEEFFFFCYLFSLLQLFETQLERFFAGVSCVRI